MKTTSLTINSREIGQSNPPYVIAEISGNHNGDINRALAIMETAKSAGADAIKLQTYTADTMTIDCDNDDFQIKEGLWKGNQLYELYQKAHTPWEWHPKLFAKGRELGITVFSTPFDETALNFLEELNCPAYKISSFEAVDIPLIEKVAATGKPIIISTGMANFEEIKDAVEAVRKTGNSQLALLHCVSGYPTPVNESNLKTIQELAQRFESVIGLSDHTLGITVSIAGVALGAAIIEKHVTLARSDGGPDAAFSLEPDELHELVDKCRTAWEALGVASFERKPSELKSLIFRRSLYVVEDMKSGDEFTAQNVRSIRPGFGLAPKNLKAIIGKKAKSNILRGTAMNWDFIS